MLTITDQAHAAITELSAAAGVPAEGGLRVEKSTSMPDAYELNLVAGPKPGDEAFESRGIRVFAEPESMTALHELVLAAETHEGENGATTTSFYFTQS